MLGLLGADGPVALAVAGNTAEITPVLIELVEVAPVTVKKFAGTPVKVWPVFGVIVIVAVYTVTAANVTGFVLHEIVAVYSVVSEIVGVGVSPVTGTVTPAIAGVAITITVLW